MAQTGDGGLIAIRDRALLLLGFAMAARRSELAALQVADIADDAGGLLIMVRSSKTDQEGKGTTVAVVRGEVACPVEALNAWLAAAGIAEGPVFRPINRHGKVGSAALSGISIGQIVQRHAGTDRTRSEGVRRPLIASRLCHVRSQARGERL